MNHSKIFQRRSDKRHKCFLCNTGIIKHNAFYTLVNENGIEENYHPICFSIVDYYCDELTDPQEIIERVIQEVCCFCTEYEDERCNIEDGNERMYLCRKLINKYVKE